MGRLAGGKRKTDGSFGNPDCFVCGGEIFETDQVCFCCLNCATLWANVKWWTETEEGRNDFRARIESRSFQADELSLIRQIMAKWDRLKELPNTPRPTEPLRADSFVVSKQRCFAKENINGYWR